MRPGRLLVRAAPYLVYGVIVFGACLYVTFPYDLLAQYGAEHWAPPGVHVLASGVKPLFPPGLQTERVTVSLDAVADRQDIVQVAGLQVRPSWLALATGRPQVRFSAELYGGRIEGRVSRTRGEDVPVWNVQVAFADLEMDRHPLTRREEEAFLRGLLGGTASARFDERGQLHAASVELDAEELVFAGRALQLRCSATSPAPPCRAKRKRQPLALATCRFPVGATISTSRPPAPWSGMARFAALPSTCVGRCGHKTFTGRKSLFWAPWWAKSPTTTVPSRSACTALGSA